MEKPLRICLSRSFPKSNLFSILEKCFKVAFVRDDEYSQSACGAIFLSRQDIEAGQPFPAERNTYIVSRRGDQLAFPDVADVPVHFSNSEFTPWPFRNRILKNNFSAPVGVIAPRSGHETILSINGRCAWAIRKSHGCCQYEAGMEIPDIPEGEPFSRWFKGHNFIELLPLVDFLRNITGLSEYRGPRQTACIMIDDPNLHFSRYGFIKFNQIAEHAKSNDYHMAFATIPIDLYHASKEAAQVFRNSPERLSLLIHGNNHLSNELGRDQDHQARISLISHALARVHKFEKNTGLSISRVMAAPHGVCSEPMMEDMARCGIEAACISFGSLYKANRERDWVVPMGIGSSTIVSGLPVFNRIHLSMNFTNEIFLAAYLNQPIIPNGHHWDLKDHLETLRSQVEVINSLPDIYWGSMQDISSLNYLAKAEGEELKVKILSRRIIVTVPSGIKSLRLGASDLTDCDGRVHALYAVNSEALRSLSPDGTISVRPGDRVLILSPSPKRVDPSQVLLPPTPIKAILRRFATESRDRLRPYSERIRSSFGGMAKIRD